MRILKTLFAACLCAVLVWSCSAGADKQIKKQLMEQGKFSSVKIANASYASTDKGKHSAKRIEVNGTAIDPADRFSVITTAYPVARTAYDILSSRNSLPDTIVVSMEQKNGQRLNLKYETLLMGEREEQIKARVNSFLETAMHNDYSGLESFCDPSLDLSSAINLFRQVDSLSNGIARYESVGFNQTTYVKTKDKDGAPMKVINTWYYIYSQKDSIRFGVFMGLEAQEPFRVLTYTINQE